MRATAVIALALMLSSATAIAQNDGEDTRDLPSPSAAGRSNPPPDLHCKNAPTPDMHLHMPVAMLNGFVGASDFTRTTAIRSAAMSQGSSWWPLDRGPLPPPQRSEVPRHGRRVQWRSAGRRPGARGQRHARCV